MKRKLCTIAIALLATSIAWAEKDIPKGNSSLIPIQPTSERLVIQTPRKGDIRQTGNNILTTQKTKHAQNESPSETVLQNGKQSADIPRILGNGDLHSGDAASTIRQPGSQNISSQKTIYDQTEKIPETRQQDISRQTGHPILMPRQDTRHYRVKDNASISRNELPAVTVQTRQIEAATSFAGGTGSESNPYQISNAAELAYLAQQVNNGNNYSNTYFILTADIQLNDTTDWKSWDETTAPTNSWTPIGTGWDNPFSGSFDGQGYIVSGIYINTTSDFQGLFGYIDYGNRIQNIGIKASYIKGYGRVGGVAGAKYGGTMYNCYNSGTIIGTYYVGGVIGEQNNSDAVTYNCYNNGSVSGNQEIGGITGMHYGVLSNCYNIGQINGNYYSGGITGNNIGTLTKCYNTGIINGVYSYVGSIAGANSGTLNDCYYLTNCAIAENGIVQNGIGANQGETTADTEGVTTAKTAGEFASGEVCWLLNGQIDANVVWYQTLGIDTAPVLDSTHGTVYANGGCQGKPATFKNNGPSEYGAHIDNNDDGHCDNCGEIIMTEPANVDGVYQIANRAELYWFAALVNGTLKDGTEQNTAAQAVLIADILLNDTTNWRNWNETTNGLDQWTPIGHYNYQFTGLFDGQGHSISGIFINTTSPYQGLFGFNNGTIQNISVTASYIKGNECVGGIAGYNDNGMVTNCYNTGIINGNYNIGGISGYNWGSVTSCYNHGMINGIENIGGITGANDETMTDCYNIGTVNGSYRVGGITGYNWNTIINCYYLTSCATDGNGTVQNGIGANQGETTADTERVTTAKSANEFASGEVCWLLNGQTDSGVTWYQTLGIDAAPVLDSTHGTVYANGGCQGKPATFKNNGPSEYGAHIDNNDDGHCDNCGEIIMTEPANVDGVYQIANRAELYWFAALVNGTLKDGKEQNTAAQAVLIADILLNDTTNWRNWNETTNELDQWTPIGHHNYQFTGLFDGQGHTVSGIYINTASNYQGLFGYNNGTIQNIGVTASYIKGNQYIGGIAGYSDNGTLTNCYNNGMVKGYWNTGGIAGYNSNNMITNCHNTGIINGDYYTGGITGYNWGTVTSCYNHGMINGIESIGGITGANDKTMANCYNTGTVNGNYRVGGITGYNWNIITNCYYLAGCATDGNGTVQNGIGANQGETTADTEGATTAKTTEEFASGEVCWLLNGQTDTDVIWYQTLDIDAAPVLDGTHSTVYANGGCQGKPAAFKNNGPSEYGAHTDNDNDGHCDFCGEIIMTEPANVDGVYQIANRAELYWFAALVNGTLKDGKEQNTAAQAVLIADIQLNDTTNWRNWNETTNGLDQWTPIGHYNYQFTGLFDGQGHTISGIYINTANSYQGLFGYVGGSGVVQNLGVIAGHISSTNGAIGGITGFCYGGTIANCYNSCFISGNNGTGGIAGYNNGGSLITNCYNNGNINGKYSLGGIAGTCYATISNSYNVGAINGNYYTGSIAGEVEGTITNCYYLAGCATDGNGTVQNGIGANQGETTADTEGATTAKTAEEFASGEVCWLLNGQTDSGVTWYQTLGIDAAPVLDGTHGTVYANGGCPSKPAAFKNEEPSIGKHTDNDNDGHCDFCGEIIMTEPANANGVYQIANRAELYWFAGLVNGTLKDGTEQNTAAQAVLIADIQLNDTTNWRNWNETTNGLDQWIPIGYYNNSSDYILFNGSFDGQGHTVSGIYINTTSSYQGLFGCNDGTIQNVGVTASYIKGNEYVGGIAGYNNNGTLTNCYNAGSINGSFCTGGITGYSLGIVTNCYNIGTIIGSEYTGGIVGYDDNNLTNCYNIGAIHGNEYTGGIMGMGAYWPINCYYLIGCASSGVGGITDNNDYITVKTAEEFASGEVCWLLNNSQDDTVWGQAIGTNVYPVLTTEHIVYKVPFINKTTGFELMRIYGNNGTELSLPTAEELGVVLIKEFTDNNGNKLENSFIVSPDLIITVDCSAYTISVADNIRHGSITPEMTEAGAGNVIHITATAEEHYMFSQLHVSYDGNTESQPDGETSFTMPAADVTLSASFIPMYAQNVSYDIEKAGIDTYNVIFTWEHHTTAFTTNIYRDNVLVAENLTEATWTDTNIAKGTYTYTFELKDADGTSSYIVGYSVDVWFYALVPQSGTENVTLGEDALPIYDNGGYNGNYANSSDGKLVINAQEGCRIKLTGNINTENNYDFVKIYDGDDTELYNSSGTYDIGTIISSGNSLSIAFTSDGSVIESGFDLLAETVYPIAVATMKNGTVVPDTLWAAAGDIVTLQAIPSDGYQLIENSLTIRKLENPSIYTVVKDYQFVMPSYKIIIMAQFSGTTNINGTENGTWTVIGMEHCLQITGTDAEASIYDTTGRLMYRGLNRMINLPVSGIYIIRIGNEVQKAVVK